MRPSDIHQYIKQLRSFPTPAERRLWEHLRAHRLHGLKFKRQVRIGIYIVDFCSTRHRLIIELDGAPHQEKEQRLRDATREAFLQSEGYRVLRFWNSEIEKHLPEVLRRIQRYLPFLPSLPAGKQALPAERKGFPKVK